MLLMNGSCLSCCLNFGSQSSCCWPPPQYNIFHVLICQKSDFTVSLLCHLSDWLWYNFLFKCNTNFCCCIHVCQLVDNCVNYFHNPYRCSKETRE